MGVMVLPISQSSSSDQTLGQLGGDNSRSEVARLVSQGLQYGLVEVNLHGGAVKSAVKHREGDTIVSNNDVVRYYWRGASACVGFGNFAVHQDSVEFPGLGVGKHVARPVRAGDDHKSVAAVGTGGRWFLRLVDRPVKLDQQGVIS